MKYRSTAAALGMLAAASSAPAADVERGREIVMQGNGKGATACIACHGVDGAGNAMAGFPRLAGLDAAYLSKQIADYRAGERTNPLMQPIASALSPEDADAVAAYYAAQAATQPADAEQLKRGERLAQSGDWSKEVPACVSCHGPNGKGVGEAFPALAGQHASYIVSQITAWRQGTRHNDPVELMKVVADRLTDEEAQAVAAYFASLSSR